MNWHMVFRILLYECGCTDARSDRSGHGVIWCHMSLRFLSYLNCYMYVASVVKSSDSKEPMFKGIYVVSLSSLAWSDRHIMMHDCTSYNVFQFSSQLRKVKLSDYFKVSVNCCHCVFRRKRRRRVTGTRLSTIGVEVGRRPTTAYTSRTSQSCARPWIRAQCARMDHLL